MREKKMVAAGDRQGDARLGIQGGGGNGILTKKKKLQVVSGQARPDLLPQAEQDGQALVSALLSYDPASRYSVYLLC